MEVECISERLNHTAYPKDSKGVKHPKRIKVGDRFHVAAIPKHWVGLVTEVDDEDLDNDEDRVAVTNPAEGGELTALKAEYKEATGKPAHHTWDAETIQEKLDELEEE